MEPIGAISEGEWSCLVGMDTTEEADFMAELLGTFPLPSQLDARSSLEVPKSAFWPSHGSTLNMAGANQDSLDPPEIKITDLYMFSQSSPAYNTANRTLFPTSNQQSRNSSICREILAGNNSSVSMDLSMEDTTSYLVGGDACLNQEMKNDNVEGMNQLDPQAALLANSSQLKTESNIPVVPGPTAKDQGHDPPKNSRKRLRNLGDAQKNKRNVQTKKMQKASISNNDEESNARFNVPTSSSCCSDDESNASHELSGGASSSLNPKETLACNLNGKARAGSGAGTDPQSLYARKRRERINERLRILQNLVPNGTKVDISTMLEEAVQYVKFLQLQIKLLSSDDLWMYAPIAYNGINIGLDLKVTPTAR